MLEIKYTTTSSSALDEHSRLSERPTSMRPKQMTSFGAHRFESKREKSIDKYEHELHTNNGTSSTALSATDKRTEQYYIRLIDELRNTFEREKQDAIVSERNSARYVYEENIRQLKNTEKQMQQRYNHVQAQLIEVTGKILINNRTASTVCYR
jgi:hypothetical protein